MTPPVSPLGIAKADLSEDELLGVVNAAFADTDLQTDDPRLILASDMISDAAMEVVALRSPKRSITKMVALDETISIPLGETGVVVALWKCFDQGKVSQEDMNALLMASSIADLIQNMQKAGKSDEEICSSEVTLTPMGFQSWLKEQGKPRGWFKRLFRS